MLQKDIDALVVSAPRPKHEAPRDAERDGRDRRRFAELRLVVGVKPHAVVAVAIAVQEHVVERNAGVRRDARRHAPKDVGERARLQGLTGIAIRHVARPRDEARLQDAFAEQDDLARFPGHVANEFAEERARLRRRKPLRVELEGSAALEFSPEMRAHARERTR